MRSTMRPWASWARPVQFLRDCVRTEAAQGENYMRIQQETILREEMPKALIAAYCDAGESTVLQRRVNSRNRKSSQFAFVHGNSKARPLRAIHGAKHRRPPGIHRVLREERNADIEEPVDLRQRA